MFKLKFIKEQYWQFHAQVAIIGSVHSIILFASIYTIIINTRFSIKDSNISCCQGKLFLIALCSLRSYPWPGMFTHLGVVSYFLKIVSSDSGGGSRGRNPGGNPRPRMKRPKASKLKSSRGQEFKPCTDLWALLWISSSASGSVAACVAAAPGGGH